MTANDGARPRAIERWLERSLPGYRFGLVLLFLLLTYTCMASGATSSWARVVTVALQGLTLLAALRASQVARRMFRIAALLALHALVSSVASLGLSPSGTTGVSFALNVLMVAGAPIAIGTALWRHIRSSTSTRCLGAICIYVLVGMLFAFLYGAIGEVGTDPFFVQAAVRRPPITCTSASSRSRRLVTGTSPPLAIWAEALLRSKRCWARSIW